MSALCNKLERICYDSFFKRFLMIILIVLETGLSFFIIFKVKYTEIDWVAYMQEVEGFLNGTLDYEKLNGQTGPLVYPAGFVYIYSVLYWLTSKGSNILLAQYIFVGFYVITLVLVFRIYYRLTHIPNYVFVFMCCTSYRIHSIYILRLFNDPIAMMFLYGAINCFMDNKYSWGSVLFSIGVSIKMNILLFAPGLLLIYLFNRGFWETLGHLAECAIVQLILGMPFLIHNTSHYLNRAFEFKRQFLYKWTVNWRLLPETLFLDRRFHLLLLGIHLILLIILVKKFMRYQNVKTCSTNANKTNIILLLFMSNFIGVACSRSLHYQFYVWYYHTLPLILWSLPNISFVWRLLIMGLIEMCWNTYPSTIYSSGILHLCHLFILFHWLKNNCFNYVASVIVIHEAKIKQK